MRTVHAPCEAEARGGIEQSVLLLVIEVFNWLTALLFAEWCQGDGTGPVCLERTKVVLQARDQCRMTALKRWTCDVQHVAHHRAIDANIFLLACLPRPSREEHGVHVHIIQRSRNFIGRSEVDRARMHAGGRRTASARQAGDGPVSGQEVFGQRRPDYTAGPDDQGSFLHGDQLEEIKEKSLFDSRAAFRDSISSYSRNNFANNMASSEGLKGIAPFVYAADSGSFASAAERLNLTSSAVSKSV